MKVSITFASGRDKKVYAFEGSRAECIEMFINTLIIENKVSPEFARNIMLQLSKLLKSDK